MKIGILTFHSQLNYGGVLQAFALQEALRAMGHDAIIINRWFFPYNHNIELHLKKRSLKDKIRACLKFIPKNFVLPFFIRRKRTLRFLSEKINLTSPGFHNWSEITKEQLGLDLIVVGSDQVWRYANGAERPYLLEGAPNIPAISYAASLAMPEIPQVAKDAYRHGLARFKAISCREAEGVKLVEQAGFKATHVIDPTLLLSRELWSKYAKKTEDQNKKLVCYFLDVSIKSSLHDLHKFAKKMKCTVHLYINMSKIPLPTNWNNFKTCVILQYYKIFGGRIKPEFSAGPQEFLNGHSNATWVMTDSFHSLMFSSIFNKNVRVIRPCDEFRKKMFSRIEEFVQKNTSGPVIADSVCEALSSFAKGETVSYNYSAIDDKQKASHLWLQSTLDYLKTQG